MGQALFQATIKGRDGTSQDGHVSRNSSVPWERGTTILEYLGAQTRKGNLAMMAVTTGTVLMRRRWRKWKLVFRNHENVKAYKNLRYYPGRLSGSFKGWQYWHVMISRKGHKL